MDVVRSDAFVAWVARLRDKRAVAKIARRLDRLIEGNPGDVRPVGQGISELRIDHGPGYRIYYWQRGSVVIVLLCGGDKSSQAQDIAAAKDLARQWKELP